MEVAHRTRVGSDHAQDISAGKVVQRLLGLEQRHRAVQPSGVEFGDMFDGGHGRHYGIDHGYNGPVRGRSVYYDEVVGMPRRRCSKARVCEGGPLIRLLSAFALIVALPAAAPVCAELPPLGDRSSGIVSVAAERELAKAALRQIRAGAPTVDDAILKYYVHLNILRLAEKSDLIEPALTTVLIDSPRINAFAVPGGVVGINLGLFLYAQDESEYSAVIAHELAHLSQRHYARGIEMQRAMTPWMLTGLLASMAIAAVGGGDAGMAAAATTQALMQDKGLRFSRSREQEADRIGLNTLAEAGLDPDGAARMFERMHRTFRFDDRPPEFLLTHPLTETRIADARNQAERFAKRTVPSSLDYQFMRARAQIRYAESPGAALVEARARKDGGDADQYALAVALADAGAGESAVDIMRVLRRDHPESLLVAASFADVLIDAGRIDEALALLQRELAINPDNEPLTFLHALALNAAQRNAEAAEVLWRHVHVNRYDVDVWELLAETAGLAGDTVGVHRARAEYFALVGAYRMAIQHIDYARRLADPDDYYLLARLDQRVIDLRSELAAAPKERS